MAEQDKSRPTQPRQFSDVSNWDMETDVVVVGFGGAGSCAAIEAADAGSEVILFELSSASGGSTALSSAEIYMGGNGGTTPQRECGFSDSTEDMVTFLLESAGELADEAKIRAYAEGSLEHFHWLQDKGVPYRNSFHKERAIMALTDDCLLYTSNEKAWPFSEHAKPCPRGHNIQVEGDNGGPLLMRLLTEQVEQRSNITVHYDARALTLIVDAQRRVRGIVVRIDRKEICVKARQGVILCAGGFVMNREMLQKYAPNLLRATEPIGNPGDTGSGILMGMGVGAAAINMNQGFVSLPYYPPERMTYGILVNAQGQRFINEDCYHGRIGAFILRQPGDRIYFIVSAENFEPPMFLGADIAGTGETIEELEQELALPEGSLTHTVNYYNRYAAEAKDPLFHKSAEYLRELQAPYAALDCTPGRGAFYPYFTLGGLDTLPSGEVLTAEGDVIPGLFAAGRTACGLPRSAEGYGSGMSVGDATFFGRLAGKQAAGSERIN